MTELSILVDLDGMVVDFSKPMLALHNQLTGDHATMSDITDHNYKHVPRFSNTWQDLYDAMGVRGFFRKLAPIPGAVEAVRDLWTTHNVTLITALPVGIDAPSAAEDKLGWCAEHLSFIEPTDIIFASSAKKHLFKADAILDDHPGTLRSYSSAWPDSLRAGIAYPYNTSAHGHAHLCDGWHNPATAWRAMVALVQAHARTVR